MFKNFTHILRNTVISLRNEYNKKRRGVKYKKNIFISKYVDLNDVEFGDYCNVAHHAQISGSKIGKRTSIGRYTKVRDAIIGSYCSISWDVTIGAVSHPLDTISTHAFTYRKRFGIANNDSMKPKEYVNIGNDVWIGCNAIIMPGINIGNGAIIGAGAIVTHDVESYSIVVGSPAKHIKYRFSNDICNALESLNWWDFSDETIKNNLKLFNSAVDEEIINLLKKNNNA